jgi:hypothetical protein
MLETQYLVKRKLPRRVVMTQTQQAMMMELPKRMGRMSQMRRL